MKIRTRLTLQNTAVVMAVFLLCMLMIYIVCERNHRVSFYRELKGEAISRARLYMAENPDGETLRAVRAAESEYPNAVETNVYDTAFRLLYGKENNPDTTYTSESFLKYILEKKDIRFKDGARRGIGTAYRFKGEDYIITATAYDTDGDEALHRLRETLVVLFVIGMTLLFIACFYLSYNSLRPIREIVKEAENISEQHTRQRLPVINPDDELGELSIAFNDLLARMEQSFNSQKMFVSNVSHEMRTPLAAIIAELDITLQKERSKKEYQKAISNALQDARRMNKLIDGLLNLAKASYHKEQIKKQKIRLDELLLDARNNILKAHPKYNIEIVFSSDDDDDDRFITVNGNLYLLNIAFANLIENNCKYSADNSSFIQISYWEKLVIVRLSDAGEGMSKRDKQNLFTLFYRGERENAVEGHGIGMALAQRIILLHDGNITVYSEQGKGTTFVVELPHV